MKRLIVLFTILMFAYATDASVKWQPARVLKIVVPVKIVNIASIALKMVEPVVFARNDTKRKEYDLGALENNDS